MTHARAHTHAHYAHAHAHAVMWANSEWHRTVCQYVVTQQNKTQLLPWVLLLLVVVIVTLTCVGVIHATVQQN